VNLVAASCKAIEENQPYPSISNKIDQLSLKHWETKSATPSENARRNGYPTTIGGEDDGFKDLSDVDSTFGASAPAAAAFQRQMMEQTPRCVVYQIWCQMPTGI